MQLKAPQARQQIIPILVLVAALALQIFSIASSLLYVGKPFAGFRFEPTLTVSSINATDWPGIKAGLSQEDRILEIGTRPASGSIDLWQLVRSVPVGTSIRYRVTGDAGTRSLLVPTALFTPWDWVDTVLPLQLIGLFFVLIGAAGFFLKPENPAGRAHLFFTAALAAFMAAGIDYDFQALWAPLYVLIVCLLGSASLQLGLAFPAPMRLSWLPRHKFWLAYVPAVVLGITGFVLFRPVGAPTNPLFHTYLDLLYGVGYTWVLLGATALIVSLVISTWRPQSTVAGQQARIALYGAVMGFLPMTLLWLVPTLAGVYADVLVRLALPSTLFFIFFPASIVYAIVRTKLFDIDLVIKRTLQYALLATVLGAVYFGTLVGASDALEWVLPKGASHLTDAVAAAVVALAFNPLSNATRKALDRLFSRQQYQAGQLLAEFGERARGAIVPQELFGAFDDIVTRAFAPVFVGVSMAGGEHYERGTSGGFALSVNLRAGDELLGLAMVGEKLSDLPYNEADRVFWSSLCSSLALAMKNLTLIRKVLAQERVTKELEIAHEVQRGILPALLPEAPGVRLSGYNQAALEMGGDFYDVIPLAGGALGLVLGDVSGKGVPAAFLGAVCLTLFRAFAPVHRSPVETLTAVNDALIRYRPSGKMFITVTYIVYQPDTGKAQGVNAGNPAPFHAGKPLEGKGLPLGARARVQYRDFALQVAEDETLVLLSDGVTDARNLIGERFGDDRLQAVVARCALAGPDDLVAAVRAQVDGFRGDCALYDDFTILALQRAPVPAAAGTAGASAAIEAVVPSLGV